MHNTVAVFEDLFYVGASDRRLSLFENVYPVPRGASYNSYLLLDEKTVLFDTVDHAVSEQFLENVEHALGGRTLDYIVVHHMEPDHSSTLSEVLLRHPEAMIVCNQKIDGMLKNYGCCAGEKRLVKEGDELSTGRHTFKFVFAPMVHWPEVMMSFDLTTGALFSADAFGTFGALGGSVWADEVDFEHDFLDDARRYYINIVGKYGVQVQNVLKKAAGLGIKYLFPLHGPLWRENIGWFVEKYLAWSSYTPEEKGVLVVYGSVYGHTQNAAEIVASRTHAERGGDRRLPHRAEGREGQGVRCFDDGYLRSCLGGVPLFAHPLCLGDVQQRHLREDGGVLVRPQGARLPKPRLCRHRERLLGAAGGRSHGGGDRVIQEHEKAGREGDHPLLRQRRDEREAPRACRYDRRGREGIGMKSIHLMVLGLVLMFAGVGCIAFSLGGGWNTLTTVGTVLTAVGFIVTAVGFFWKKKD